MDIVDKIQSLFDKNMSLYSIEKELKMGNGIIGKWRKQSPSCDRISKVANHLDCSVDYLLGRTDNPKSHKSSMSENELALLKRYAELDSHGKSLVDTIIDKEYDRCTKSNIIKTPNEYKTAYVAAFGGGTTEINIPANVSADEINQMMDEQAASDQRTENEKTGDEIIEKANKNK